MRAVFFPVFFGCFVSLLAHRRHLLYSLLALEAIILRAIISISFFSSIMFSNLILIVIFVLAVAEASLGLSVLVRMRRLRGNDIVAS